MIIHGNKAFQDSVRAYVDANPRSQLAIDYQSAANDRTAVFVVAQEVNAITGQTYGGLLEDGSDNRPFLAGRLQSFNIKNPYDAPIRGMITIGAAKTHKPYDCQLRHEFVHLRGLFWGGSTQSSYTDHAEFTEINIGMGCDGNTHARR